MRQNREESKSIPKAAARAKPHGEVKKKKPKAGTERRNKSCRRKKEKKERDFNFNVSNVCIKVRVISFNERD